MRKKIISLIMAIVLSASLALFPACEFIDSTLNNEQSSSQTSEDLPSSESTSSSSDNGCEEHTFGEWETVFEPLNCATIGEKQRICTKCNDVESEEILPAFSQHTFNAETLCTTCGHQEFIESEEYIEYIAEPLTPNSFIIPHYNWKAVNESYGLTIIDDHSKVFISGCFGNPINVIIPASLYGASITSTGGNWGFGSVICAFSDCKTLESIIIPEGILEIYMYSFSGCISLEKVQISNSVTSIMMYAFENCTSLTNIKIPENVKYISYGAFQGCINLKQVYISKNCEVDRAFNNCHPDLEIIYYD